MALLTVQDIVIEGLQETFVPADAGLTDTFDNTGNEFAKVVNGGGAPIVVTPTVTGEVTTGETIEPTPVTVPAGESRLIGALNTTLYSKVASIVYSDVTSVTVGIFKLARTQTPVIK